MIKLVAFDWNGTLFADSYAIYKSDLDVCKLLKIKPISFQAFQKYYDVPIKNFYLALGVSEKEFNKKAAKIANVFHRHYEERSAKLRTRSYARRLLEWLSENNIESIIFSNHIVDPIKKQLKRLRLKRYILAVLASSHLQSALKGRSKQEKLKHYMREHKLLPKEVLIVGDTVEEIEIGRELGVITVAITHGNCSITRLKKAKPDYLINSLKEVIGIISSH